MQVKKIVIQCSLSLAATFAISLPSFATSGIMYVSGSRTLTEDHRGTIVLNANATLNCNGRKIRSGTQAAICGPDADRTCGVFINANSATVRNCTIEGFDTGIEILDVLFPTVEDNQVYENTVGIRIRDVFGGNRYVRRNTIMENLEEGINIDNSYNLNINENHVSYNKGDGIDVGGSQTLIFTANRVTDNGRNGIELDGSSFNAVMDNYVSHNGRNANRSGISLDASDYNRISCNASNHNGRNGIRITDGSDSNIIDNNYAARNIVGDAEESPDSLYNTWQNNVFRDRGNGSTNCN